MDPDRLLDGLNEPQVTAVTARGGPVVVHAGAGSGKTRVLIRRIAYRIVTGDTDPRHVLALTFTRKAANELQSRLRQLGLRDQVVAGTFHSVALTQLRRRWEERGIEPPTVLDRKYAMVAQLLGRRRDVEVQDVIGEIEWSAARMIDPADYHVEAEKAGTNAASGSRRIRRCDATIRSDQEAASPCRFRRSARPGGPRSAESIRATPMRSAGDIGISTWMSSRTSTRSRTRC